GTDPANGKGLSACGYEEESGRRNVCERVVGECRALQNTYSLGPALVAEGHRYNRRRASKWEPGGQFRPLAIPATPADARRTSFGRRSPSAATRQFIHHVAAGR